MDDVAAQTTRLLLRRLGYLLALITFLNTLDRVNISFAALTMNQEIGLDPKTYGFGVGLFFISYMLFQIPAVALAERFGLARSIATMCMGWGLTSACMGLVQDKHTFYALRFVLGFIEAGAAPAAVLYISRWAPSATTARFVSRNAMAMPASFILGAPLSGWLMASFHDVGGLSGWRWMLMIEGAMTVAVGALAFVLLVETPAQARWLNETQRGWLLGSLERDSRPASSNTPVGTWSARFFAMLRDIRIWSLGLAMFLFSMGFYGFLYWLPQVVKLLTPQSSGMTVMLISAVPWIGAAAGMLLIGWSSDRARERRFHVAGAALVAASGLALAAVSHDPRVAFAGLVIAGFGVGGAQGLFFTIPIESLRGSAVAVIAFPFINVLGNAAGLVGANIIGLLRSATGSFVSSIVLMSVAYILGAALILAVGRRAKSTP